MQKRISKSEFVRAFDEMNRAENFSVLAREALYDYLADFYPDFDLDVIALCCEFSELDGAEFLQELKENFSYATEQKIAVIHQPDGFNTYLMHV